MLNIKMLIVPFVVNRTKKTSCSKDRKAMLLYGSVVYLAKSRVDGGGIILC